MKKWQLFIPVLTLKSSNDIMGSSTIMMAAYVPAQHNGCDFMQLNKTISLIKQSDYIREGLSSQLSWILRSYAHYSKFPFIEMDVTSIKNFWSHSSKLYVDDNGRLKQKTAKPRSYYIGLLFGIFCSLCCKITFAAICSKRPLISTYNFDECDLWKFQRMGW